MYEASVFSYWNIGVQNCNHWKNKSKYYERDNLTSFLPEGNFWSFTREPRQSMAVSVNWEYRCLNPGGLKPYKEYTGQSTGEDRDTQRKCFRETGLPLNFCWILSVHNNIGIARITGEEGNGNPLQYSCLENPVDRGVWWAALHGVARSRTQLKRLSMHACIGEGNGNPLQCSCLENPRGCRLWGRTELGTAEAT